MLPTTAAQEQPPLIRIGIIGCDTSHVPAFTSLFNDPKNAGDLAGFKVVAAFPAGTDIPDSKNRVANFTEQIRTKWNVEIVNSIDELLPKVDVVLLESVDGRPHLAQATPVLQAKKPVFIDKPLAASLEDARRIVELSKTTGTPMFTTSSVRYVGDVPKMRGIDSIGKV